MNGINPSMLWVTIVTVMALIIAAVSILTLIKLVKELRGPKVEEQKTIEQKLARDNERLETLEENAAKQDTELKLLLRSQMAMLHHMIDGNGVENLQRVQAEINEYLIYGKTSSQ